MMSTNCSGFRAAPPMRPPSMSGWAQMKSLLEGKKTLVRGLKGKKGSYDAYLIPEGIEDYSYIKDGKEIKGSQYKFKMEFPPRKSK